MVSRAATPPSSLIALYSDTPDAILVYHCHTIAIPYQPSPHHCHFITYCCHIFYGHPPPLSDCSVVRHPGLHWHHHGILLPYHHNNYHIIAIASCHTIPIITAPLPYHTIPFLKYPPCTLYSDTLDGIVAYHCQIKPTIKKHHMCRSSDSCLDICTVAILYFPYHSYSYHNIAIL